MGMTNNIEELMKPRFRVIADYPGSNFLLGSIIESAEPLHGATKAFSYTDKKGDNLHRDRL